MPIAKRDAVNRIDLWVLIKINDYEILRISYANYYSDEFAVGHHSNGEP